MVMNSPELPAVSSAETVETTIDMTIIIIITNMSFPAIEAYRQNAAMSTLMSYVIK